MKKLFTLIAFAAVLGLTAQNIPPQAINFQGVAIDKNGIPVPGMDELGNPIQNSAIRVRFSILTGSATGTVSYQEEHLTSTDEFGRFNLEIGRGTATNGTFAGINWGGDKHFLQVEVDLSALGINYTLASVQEFLSVPYALYAKTAGSTGDGDTDPTNELQELSLSGNLLTISGGNTVTLPSSSDNQTLSIVGTTLTISNGNSVVIPDAQTLSLSGTSLSISNGNTVSIPANTDNQTLALSGNNLSISNGNSVTLPTSLDNDTTNELQHLVLNGSQLGLTKSGVTVNLASIGQGSNLSQNSFCLSGGQYYDLSSLFNSYSNVGVEAILLSKILISCYDATLGSARFFLNRTTGVLTPFTAPSSIGFMRNSDSLLYMIGSPTYVYNVNSNTYLDTFIVSNASGHAAVDFKTNKLVYTAGSNLYSYNPSTETQISIPTPSGISTGGISRMFFIGADSIYLGTSLYNANSLVPLLINVLPSMGSFVYDYNNRHFTYKVSTYYPFNQNPPRHQLKRCNRFGGAIQNASDEYIQTIGGPSVPGTGAGFELKSTINGDVIMYWDGGAFVFNNYWFTESTQTWLRMKNDGYVEQITPGNISVWGGFDFYQHPKNTVVNLLFNKNCVDNQMVNKGIYLFNR